MVQSVLEPLREQVMREIKNLSVAKTKENWFVLLLANFVLLSTYRPLMQQQVHFALRKNSAVRIDLLHSNRVNMAADENCQNRYSNMQLVCGLLHGANTILAYFHHICKGQVPLLLDWSLENAHKRKMADLSREEVRFLRELTQMAQGRRKCLLRNRRSRPNLLTDEVNEFGALMKSNDYEREHWFTGQLFLPKWTPPEPIKISPPSELLIGHPAIMYGPGMAVVG
jgi:hypothetical protein